MGVFACSPKDTTMTPKDNHDTFGTLPRRTLSQLRWMRTQLRVNCAVEWLRKQNHVEAERIADALFTRLRGRLPGRSL